MPRKRKKHSRWPPYVNVSKGRIVWRPYRGRDNGKTVFGPEIVLFPRSNVNDGQVWDEYNRITSSGPRHLTVEWLLDRFVKSKAFKDLAERTQSDYRKYREAIISRPVKNGVTFGTVDLNSITIRTINTYLSTASAPIQANRQMAMLSSAWNWVNGEEKLPQNPVPGCRWNKEKPKTRYVEDWEYKAVKEQAGPHLQAAMEIIYLCRLRKCEAIELETERDCLDNGLLARRRKGSKTQIIALSTRLEEAIELAKSLHGDEPKFHLLVTRNKEPYTLNGLPSSLRGAMNRAIAAGTLKSRFSLHDLKRKGVSDFEGTAEEKINSAGHKDRRTAGIYDVKPGKTRSTR